MNLARSINFWYLKELVFPSQIVLIHTLPAQTSGTGLNIMLCVLVFLIIFFIFKRRWQKNKSLFALLWLILGFIIPLSFVEYFLTAYQNVLSKIMVALLALSWFMLTKSYNHVWQTQKSYCLFLVRIAPDYHFPNFWLADSFLKEKNFKKAEIIPKNLWWGEVWIGLFMPTWAI